MAKIILNDVLSGYNLQVINDNFQKIEAALNDDVLYRENVGNTDNSMRATLDMNGHDLINVGTLAVSNLDIGGVNLAEQLLLAKQYADSAAEDAQIAESAAIVASDAENQSVNVWEDFNTKYLGEKASDPVVDNNGDPLVAGALYFNSAINSMRVYDGAIWSSLVIQTASDIDFLAEGPNAVVRSVQSKLRDVVSVADYGIFSPDNTPMNNKAVLQNAIDAVPTGGTLIIPANKDGRKVVVDTSQGLSGAVQITKPISIYIYGHIAANYGTMQSNPPYIFDVISDNVNIFGPGSLSGDGSIDDTNSGDITTMPGLIHVQGGQVRIEGLTFDTVPKIGVSFVNCAEGAVNACTFKGGPTEYTVGHTGYFGIRTYGGGRHNFTNNRFTSDSGGGKLINCIFMENTSVSQIVGNIAYGVYEKLSYIYGNYNNVVNNVVMDTTITDAFRFYGSYNKLIGNYAVDVNGGTQIFDGVYNEVAHNIFNRCRQIGVNVGRSDPSYASGFSGTKIVDNIILGAVGSKTDGIRVISAGGGSTGIVISGNTVSGFASNSGEGAIRLEAPSPYSIADSRIQNNMLDTAENGIVLSRGIDSHVVNNMFSNGQNVGILLNASSRISVEGNSFVSPGNYAVDLDGSTYIQLRNNRSRDSVNIGFANMANEGCWGRGNSFSVAPLVGTLTLSASASTIVSHGGVADYAVIMLQERNPSAGALAKNKGRCFADGVTGNILVTTADNTAAAGTEIFSFEIIQ